MECENVVSIWMGCFDTEEQLNEYAQEKYTEDGDRIPSKFCEDFFGGEEPYGYDFFECFLSDESSDEIRCLLEGCSYDETVIKSLESAVGKTLDKKHNAVIMTFDFEYNGKITENSDKNLKFISAVHYEKYD